MAVGLVENLQQILENSSRDKSFVYLLSNKGSTSYSEIVGLGNDNFYGTAHMTYSIIFQNVNTFCIIITRFQHKKTLSWKSL